MLKKNNVGLNIVVASLSFIMLIIPVTLSISMAQQKSPSAEGRAGSGGALGMSKVTAGGQAAAGIAAVADNTAAGEAGSGGTAGMNAVAASGNAGSGGAAVTSTATIVGVSAAVVAAGGFVAKASSDDDSSTTAAHHHH